MNQDFVEMLSALSGEGAEFLVVGGHALAAHGLPRATKDLDSHSFAQPLDQEQESRGPTARPRGHREPRAARALIPL